jgi:hypothetical protein
MTFAFFLSYWRGNEEKIICTEDHKGHKGNPFDRNGLRLEPRLSSPISAKGPVNPETRKLSGLSMEEFGDLFFAVRDEGKRFLSC